MARRNPKPSVAYRDNVIGAVKVRRETAAKVLWDWRRQGHKPKRLDAPPKGKPSAGYLGPDYDHYFIRGPIRRYSNLGH